MAHHRGLHSRARQAVVNHLLKPNSVLSAFLERHTGDDSLAQMGRVLANRTRHLVAVTEDLYQPHNGAAAIRTCEAFGVQDLYAIANRNPFRVSPEIEAGASRWVSLHHYGGPGTGHTRRCLGDLKQRGYRVLSTSLRPGGTPLSELELDQKTALCFGTELAGLSDEAHDLADGFLHIPMYGFTDSFNISVSLALSLSCLANRLRASSLDWRLSPAESTELRLQWLWQLSNPPEEELSALLATRGLSRPSEMTSGVQVGADQ